MNQINYDNNRIRGFLHIEIKYCYQTWFYGRLRKEIHEIILLKWTASRLSKIADIKGLNRKN